MADQKHMNNLKKQLTNLQSRKSSLELMIKNDIDGIQKRRKEIETTQAQVVETEKHLKNVTESIKTTEVEIKKASEK